MSEAFLGVAYIDIIARASKLAQQAQGEVRTALVGAENAAVSTGGNRIAKNAETQLSTGLAKGARSGMRDLELETRGALRRVGGQAAGFLSSAFGIGGKPLAIAAIGISVGLLAKSAVDYQEQTAKLANSAQISDKAAGQIGQAFLGTAGKTTFSAKQMISAYAPIAGVFRTIYGHALSTAEAVKFMSQAQNLAEASGQPLANVTKNLSQILITYHLGLNQTSDAADILYNTSRNLGVPLSDLQSQFQRLAPRLAGTGTTLGQTAGLFQELAKQVGTGRFALRTAGIAVQNLVMPSANAKAALASLGISLNDSHGKFIGLNPAIEKIHNALLKLPAGVAGAAAAQKLQTIAINETKFAQEKLAIQTELFGQSQGKQATQTRLLALAQQKQVIQDQIARLGTEHHSKTLTDQIGALRRSALGITQQEQALRSGTAATGQHAAALRAQLTAIGLQEQAYKLQTPALQHQAAALNKNGLLTALFGRQANIMGGIIAGGVPALNKAIAATNAHGTAQKAAEKVSHTLGGQLKTLRAAASDLGVEIGQKLAPIVSLLIVVFTDALTAVTAVFGFISDHATIFEIAGAFIGVFALAIGGATVATSAYAAAAAFAAGTNGTFTAAWAALNLIMGLNPIFLIVAAVAALAAAIYIAYTKIKPFRDAVDEVGRALKTAFIDSLHAVETAFSVVIDFVSKHWKIIAAVVLLPIAPIALVILAVKELATHWSLVWNGMLQVAGFIVGTIIQDVIKPIVSAFLAFARAIIGAADDAFGWVPGIGGKLHKARKAVQGFSDDTNKTLQGWANQAFSWGDSAGGNLAAGMASGIAKKKAAAAVAVKGLSGTAVKELHMGLEIGSPSKVAERAGGFFGMGFAVGVERTIARVVGAVGRMHSAASGATPGPGFGGVDRIGAATRGHDGSEMLQELRLLRMELTGQRAYFITLARETKALPHAIGDVLTKAGDFRYAPRELRA